MEQRRSARAGRTEDLLGNPPASGIVRHDTHMPAGSLPLSAFTPRCVLAALATAGLPPSGRAMQLARQPGESLQLESLLIDNPAWDIRLCGTEKSGSGVALILRSFHRERLRGECTFRGLVTHGGRMAIIAAASPSWDILGARLVSSAVVAC
ncbi:hypothetical protein PR048_010471 [Dryococelus australis]|uniref:Uncharacterized protein n=1 Tax=Dryococelus australis TaxID=614101 RepID=A0ABQ9I3A2_9NEOP|nr:hypothetical protein PR048_010471 [Dryococelus australis]